MQLSYWEIKNWFSNVDFAIVGSGIVGLHTAIRLRERFPKAKIILLEKGALPQGASTKNAGFACFGSVSEIIDDLKTHTEEEVIQLIQKRYAGLQLLRNNLGDAAIDYQPIGGYELFLKEDEAFGPEQEKMFLQAAEVLGFDSAEYSKATDKNSKLTALNDWQHQHERYLVKPMNCPHHAQIYKAQPHSYRSLPLRLFEFGTVYRYEQTGELNGMLRVRGLTQDDAHIFCTADQVEQEFRNTIELTRFVLESVGLSDYRVQLSLRDPKSDKYVGSEENWQKAESALRKVLEESGLNFTAAEGEAAFYGPKADFMVRDCIGRQWQLGTVQLDYNLPERFQLEYTGADNKSHRPVMIHRAPFGSMERFVGMLTEHFAGAFPMWLAPEQIRICPLSEKTNDYALELEKQFIEAGFRVTTDLRGAKVQAKIRDAQLELIPYMAVIGPKEAETRSIALRDRIDGELGTKPVEEVMRLLTEEVNSRRIRQVAERPAAEPPPATEATGHEY
jgi:threonyl-tRNA synthetase